VEGAKKRQLFGCPSRLPGWATAAHFNGTKQLQSGFTEPSVAGNADSALMRGTSEFLNERGGIVDDASNVIPSDLERAEYVLFGKASVNMSDQLVAHRYEWSRPKRQRREP